MSNAPKRIVFVCTGNICRSPMAAALFRHRLGNPSGWDVQSAGVFASSGSPASENAERALAELGIDLTQHLSQPLTRDLAESADLIIAMTNQHRDEIIRGLGIPEERVHLMTSFGTDNREKNVHDPIGGNLHVYKTVRDQIDSGVSDLILYLMGQGLLEG